MSMSLEEYVSKFSGYPRKLAEQYYHQVVDSGIEFQDLVQEGYLAMIAGYHNYDEKKSALSTYAYTTVKYGIINYINKKNLLISVKPDFVVAAAKLERVRTLYYMETGNEMPMDEMIEFMNDKCSYLNDEFDEKTIKLLMKITRCYSNSSIYSLDGAMYKEDGSNNKRFDDNNLTIGDCITLDYSLEDEVVLKMFAKEILDYVKYNFSEKDLEIFKERFGFVDDVPKNYDQIGKKIGISRQGISNRHQKVMNRVIQKFNN